MANLLITLQSDKYTFGYFSADRLTDQSTISELKLNPNYFVKRSLRETLSKLAHKICHVWQHCEHDQNVEADIMIEFWIIKIASIKLMSSNTVYKAEKVNKRNTTLKKDSLFQQVVYN